MSIVTLTSTRYYSVQVLDAGGGEPLDEAAPVCVAVFAGFCNCEFDVVEKQFDVVGLLYSSPDEVVGTVVPTSTVVCVVNAPGCLVAAR